MAETKFTGRTRQRRTKARVKLADAAARALITIGGFGTIIAVSTVCIFLVWIVVPMFLPAKAEEAGFVAFEADRNEYEAVSASSGGGAPLHVAIDDYNLIGWAFFPDTTIRVFKIATGEILNEKRLIENGPALTAWSFPQEGAQTAFGFEDGSIRLGSIGFTLSFMEPDQAPEELRRLAPLEVAAHDDAIAQMTREGQVRMVRLDAELAEPIQTGSPHPVILLDHTGGADRPIIASLTADHTLRISQVRTRRNLMTGQTTMTATGGELALNGVESPPSHLKLTGLGDNVYLIRPGGELSRFDTRRYDDIRLVEQLDLIDDPAVRLTVVGFLIGKTTLLVGDDHGNVSGWFRTRPMIGGGADGISLTRVQRLDPHGAGPVTHIAVSQRKRIVAVGHEHGVVRLHNVTNERFFLQMEIDPPAPVASVALNPRDNGLVALAGGTLLHWNLDVPHPEISTRAIFGKMWYEGADGPEHVWQSTGGTDDFESKYGLVPLIFGTVKATFYSMLFGVPLAILAAIYTSEFLHRRWKSAVKPTVEMMASLPSVVLGFLAGLVIAPFIEGVVPAALAALMTVPFAFLLASYFWQLLPDGVRLRFEPLRFAFIAMALPLGIWLAMVAGPIAEQALFRVDTLDPATSEVISTEYDIKTWLSVQNVNSDRPQFASSPTGGWFILFLPISVVLGAFLTARHVNPLLTTWSARWSRRGLATADFAKFVIGAGLTVLLSLTLSELFGSFWDPRGTYVDTYVQRNALVVGFIMGFAIIPIIYTIADDAMSAVPEHLRSASLGAGATRWQTAVRIIVPTAMSGLFSAVMIGFGRAVGETMIVLMAAGNTPVLDWNIFNGFRTLSANIAVELPEAVRNSTNYRMLFLAALTLFVMTFSLNTAAEIVRQRYRKRAYQL